MSTGFVVLSRDPVLRGAVANAGAISGDRAFVARDADDLIAALAADSARAVIDGFLDLVATDVRSFAREDRLMLQAIATRLAIELAPRRDR